MSIDGKNFSIISGSILIALSLFFAYNNLKKYPHYLEAEGTVVDIHRVRQSGRTDVSYTVSFHTSKQTRGVFRTEAPFFRTFDRGERVGIKYDSRNPSNATLNDPISLWGVPGIFLFFGSFLLVSSRLEGRSSV
ncbi:MAG: DUF3592 domain-containing protein [Pseudobacteriovorax sp.]|nr:DUF3592 domain-containing protein [Pseudobacteriovorax sp.]